MRERSARSSLDRRAGLVSLLAVLLLRLLLGSAPAKGIVQGSSIPELPSPTLSFELSAALGVGPGPAATGGVNVALGDGSVRFVYRSVGGTTWRSELGDQQCLVFFLGGLPSGGLDPTDSAIAILREGRARPGVIEVEFASRQALPGSHTFAVAGRLAGTAGEPARRPSPVWFLAGNVAQRVSIEGAGVKAGLSSSVEVRRDHGAVGFVALDLADGDPPILFEAILGTLVPGAETGTGAIAILLAPRGAPLRMANLVSATVYPDPLPPDGDLWDFGLFSEAEVAPR